MHHREPDMRFGSCEPRSLPEDLLSRRPPMPSVSASRKSAHKGVGIRSGEAGLAVFDQAFAAPDC